MDSDMKIGEPKALRNHRFPTFLISFLVVVSALGSFLLLAVLTWAAPQKVESTPRLASFSGITDTRVLYLPVVIRQPTPTPPPTPTPIPFPPIQGASYTSIPVDPYYQDGRTDYAHADLNLELRGYALTNCAKCGLGLVDYNGSTDSNAPRLAYLFSPPRLPAFIGAYQVYDWQWLAPPNPGYRGSLLSTWPLTLIWMATGTDEIIHLPNRNGDIYQGNWHAQVLYATEDQITFVYTRNGNAAYGYTVHIVNIWVDPQLVALYEACNAAGRYNLPALANGQPFGRAKAGGIGVAIRDNGTFMDPRSRKDWWPGW
jgi:hypothetical protein